MQAQGLDVDFRVATAEETGLPDASFDIVTAGQCWHWFDRPKAAREVRRLLKPGGTVIIAHFDWLPLKDNIVDLTEKLVIKFNPALGKVCRRVWDVSAVVERLGRS